MLVFGGSLGARSLNLAAIEAFAGASFHVLHVCGERDYPDLAREQLRRGYELHAQLEPADFSDALAAADLVVARAGGSVFEIAAHGLPAVLIPYPHATGDHQSGNARWMVQAGAATVIEDRELSASRLAAEVAALLADRSRLAAMAAAARGLARPDAAVEVAREVLEVARGCSTRPRRRAARRSALSAGTAEEYTSSTPAPAGTLSALWPMLACSTPSAARSSR